MTPTSTNVLDVTACCRIVNRECLPACGAGGGSGERLVTLAPVLGPVTTLLPAASLPISYATVRDASCCARQLRTSRLSAYAQGHGLTPTPCRSALITHTPIAARPSAFRAGGDTQGGHLGEWDAVGNGDTSATAPSCCTMITAYASTRLRVFRRAALSAALPARSMTPSTE